MIARVMVLLTVSAAAGCQSYRAQPLDSSEVLRSWRDRTPASHSVKAVADALVRQAPTTRPAFDAADGLSLGEAELVALLFNAELRRARFEANVARVGAAEAGRWDDPSIGVDLERILSGADDRWVVGGLVNLTIPLSGRLQVEKKLASLEHRVAELRALRLERQTIAELRRAWAQWSAATMKARVLESAIADLQSIESAMTKLRDAGESDPTDVRLFSIDLVRRRGQLLSARRDVAHAESTLRQLMGLAPQTPLNLVDGGMTSSVATAVDVEAHPDVAIAKAEYDVAERSLELEIRKQFPDVQLGIGPGTDQGDTRLLGGVSIPLPLLNANRRGIAEARAKRDVARAEFESVLTRVETARAQSRRSVDSARQLMQLIEQELVPLVDRQLLEARRLLDVGEFNALLVREAIDSATEAKLDLISHRQLLDEAVVEQLLLTEIPFAATPAPETK